MGSMRSYSTTTTVEPSNTSNRRQPVRQTRTNPARSAARPLGRRGSLSGPLENEGNATPAPGFFPAVTHFTDAITALPKEMMRHSTMLKEVDAKVYGPEDAVKQLVTAALKAHVPPRQQPAMQTNPPTISHVETSFSATALSHDPGAQSQLAQGEVGSRVEAHQFPDPTDLPRRKLFQQLRFVMGEMLMTLDEKNHVLSTATDALGKQLARCDSSYPHIQNEVSEEARYGNLNHWAYMEKTVEKKGTTAGERTRREAAVAHGAAIAAAAAAHDGETALRSEARREALAARKQQNKQVDSDFDDGRGAGHSTGRKNTGAGKGRKPAEPTVPPNGIASGLGIINSTPIAGVNGPNKRRKIEKPLSSGSVGGLTMERSLSGVFGASAGIPRGGAGSPRETPAVEPRKGRARGGAAINGTGRRRANTNASVINSPSIASSPVVTTFAAPTKGANSPVLTTVQRTQSSRARQNSTHSIVQDTVRKKPPPSNSSKQTNGNGLHVAQVDVDKTTGSNGKNTVETKKPTKESPLAEEQTADNTSIGGGDGAGDLPIPKRPQEKALKREETENGGSRSRADRPPSISTSTRGAGKASKTATPISGSFPEPQRPRSGRASEFTVKRSHKKGAGLAAQLAAQAAAAEEGSPIQGDGEEEEEEDDPTNLRYCYCNGVSYGDMVACDSETCKGQWFHYECAGLTKAPMKNTKWYCRDCKESMKKGVAPGSR